MPKPRKHAEPLALPPSAGRKLEPSSSLSTTSSPLIPPLVQPGRSCKTDGCNETLEPETAMSRCFRCILQDWKLRGRKRGEEQGQIPEGGAKKKRRVVSWADEVHVDGERAASCSSFAGSSSTTDRSTQSSSTSTQVSSAAAEAVCHPASSPQLQPRSLELAQPVPSTICGWDSDLTELSDLSDSSDSSSETDGGGPSKGSSLVCPSTCTK